MDILFTFEVDEERIVFYKDDMGKMVSHKGWLIEDTIISIASHEAIEYLLRQIETDSWFVRVDIHQIIGGSSSHYKKKIKPEDYIGNVNGLPNLPNF